MGSGDKAKLVNALDNVTAHTVGMRPLYSIELILAKGRETGTLAAGIFVYKMRSMGHYFDEVDVFKERDERELVEMHDEGDQATDQLDRVEKFRKGEVGWPAVVFDRVLALYDGHCKGKAQIKIACPELHAQDLIRYEDVPARRFSSREMFATFMKAEKLLESGFKEDPWSGAIRRGIIGADRANR